MDFEFKVLSEQYFVNEDGEVFSVLEGRTSPIKKKDLQKVIGEDLVFKASIVKLEQK